MSFTEKLKEESHLLEEVEKAKAGLATELSTLREHMDKAKVDDVAEFRAFQPFIVAYDAYYDDGFEDGLKQVESVYPDLNLSKVTLEDPVPMTPRGGDTVNEESDDSTHTKE
nr:hypothetical protein CFP56_50161 [Quercus suber]